jgi:microcystin-dependent protein
MLCDGRALNRTDARFTALFNQIGSSWGGDGVNLFNIPDLRGLFLRGVDNGTGRDPDVASRTASNPGGHTGNLVGSVQPDQLRVHQHTTHGVHLEASAGHGFDGTGFKTNSGPNPAFEGDFPTSPIGGAETRPKNAYVNWIIRFN